MVTNLLKTLQPSLVSNSFVLLEGKFEIWKVYRWHTPIDGNSSHNSGSGMLIPGSNVHVTLPRLQSHSFENYYCMIMTNDKNRSRRMKSITCTKLQNSCTCRFRVENEKSVLCSKKKWFAEELHQITIHWYLYQSRFFH